MTVSQILKRLRREYWALKTAYAATATTIRLTTKTLTFSTSKNQCHAHSDNYDYDYDGDERIILTLDTASGANTLANLEMSSNADGPAKVRRVPYAGGARWIITNIAKQSGGSCAATTYQFTVQTLVDGTLSAKMEWQ